MSEATDILRRFAAYDFSRVEGYVPDIDALLGFQDAARAHLARVEGERGVRLPTAIEEDMIAHPDGDYVYWPTGGSGCYDARILRAIASKLDELNAPTERSSEEK